MIDLSFNIIKETMNHLSLPNPYLFQSTVARAATPEDVAIMAAKLRPECDHEIRAATGHAPMDAFSADLPSIYVVANRDGLPLATLMICANPNIARSCVLHVAVSADVTKHNGHKHVVSKVTEAVFALHRAGMDSVHSFVDARNVSTACLLTGCGFSFVQRHEKYGHEERPFGQYVSKISSKVQH